MELKARTYRTNVLIASALQLGALACSAADGREAVDEAPPVQRSAGALEGAAAEPATADVDGEATDSEERLPMDLGPDGEPLTTNGNDDARDKIFTISAPDASRFRQRGAIWMCFDEGGCCSGSILNNGVVLTAAHCLPTPNRNGYHNVTISYQPPIDVDAPVCFDCPSTRRWRFDNSGALAAAQFFCPDCGGDNRMFFYPHPNQKESNPDRVDSRWDFAVGAICAAGAVCDDGTGSTQTLGLPSRDFMTLSTSSLANGTVLAIHGSGLPDAGNQHKMNVRMDSVKSDYVDWVSWALFEYTCSGDSGAPVTRDSGYSDRVGSYWLAQTLVHNSGVTLGEFSRADNGMVTGQCGAEGRASRVAGKTDWITEIVEFWTNRTCTQFTNPAGGQALWCWDSI